MHAYGFRFPKFWWSDECSTTCYPIDSKLTQLGVYSTIRQVKKRRNFILFASVVPGMSPEQVTQLIGAPQNSIVRVVPVDSTVGLQSVFQTKISAGDKYQEWWYSIDKHTQLLVVFAETETGWVVSCSIRMPRV